MCFLPHTHNGKKEERNEGIEEVEEEREHEKGEWGNGVPLCSLHCNKGKKQCKWASSKLPKIKTSKYIQSIT